MDKLKKCPFCGKEVFLGYSSARHAFRFLHMGLRNCPFYVFEISDECAKTLNEAAELWNRRTKDE